MSYVTKHLSRGEEVVYASRQHWFAVIARMGVWILVTIVAVALAIWIGTNDTVLDNSTVDGAITVVVLVAMRRDARVPRASSSGTGATRSGSSPPSA